MKKLILAVAVLSTLASLPVYAGEGAAVKTLSYIEFSGLPQNRGVDSKIVNRKYQEYRSGRLPATTLDTASMR